MIIGNEQFPNDNYGNHSPPSSKNLMSKTSYDSYPKQKTLKQIQTQYPMRQPGSQLWINKQLSDDNMIDATRIARVESMGHNLHV